MDFSSSQTNNARSASSALTTSATSSAASSQHQSPANNIAVPAPVDVRTASTEPFLKDFTLVAEAAKRAQMAVMVRDFEQCGL